MNEPSQLSPEDILEPAWSTCAPGRVPGPFPRGFWPDVARVAVFKALNLPLDFRPTMCERAGLSAPRSAKAARKSRAENTAALLAELGLPTKGATSCTD